MERREKTEGRASDTHHVTMPDNRRTSIAKAPPVPDPPQTGK